MDTVEKKLPVRNLERIAEKKFWSYEGAKAAAAIVTADPVTTTSKELVAQLAKTKIFRRNDGSFDLVFYRKIQTKAPEAKPDEKQVEEKAHGLKSKDRKKKRVKQ